VLDILENVIVIVHNFFPSDHDDRELGLVIPAEKKIMASGIKF
jgi:hypothetical protein